jgi:hypothetical protein
VFTTTACTSAIRFATALGKECSAAANQTKRFAAEDVARHKIENS